MKLSRWSILLVVGVLLCTSLACGPAGVGGVHGSGYMDEKAFEVAGFDEVELGTIGQLTIKLGDEETLRVEAEENLLEYFEVEVRDDKLHIDSRDGVGLWPTRPVNFYLTVKSLEAVELSGSGNIEVTDDLEADAFATTIGGSGNVTLAKVSAPTVVFTVDGSGNIEGSGVDADTLTVKISGSGKIMVDGGEAARQTVTIAGSGTYQAEELDSQEAEVQIPGSGSATLTATEDLTAHISGSGDIRYIGEPTVNQTVTGSGRVAPIKD